MKKLLYTINFGNYDNLKEPYVTPGWDYICFSDRKIESENWEVVNILDSGYFKVRDLSPRLRARCVYINSHIYTLNYDYSIMIGGQIRADGDLDFFMEQNFDMSKDFNLMLHPCRTSIYQEADIIKRDKIDEPSVVNHQMERYRAEGMPDNFGLSACGIIGRYQNKCVENFEKMWWNEVLAGSYRDQLSFDYVRWKSPECSFHWFDYWSTLHGNYFSVYQRKTGKKL